jgi:hypothetical protein
MSRIEQEPFRAWSCRLRDEEWQSSSFVTFAHQDRIPTVETQSADGGIARFRDMNHEIGPRIDLVATNEIDGVGAFGKR